MPRALRPCPCLRCPAHEGYGCTGTKAPGQSKCTPCQGQGNRARGTRRQRGYDEQHLNRFRPGVLHRDPLCTCTTPGHGHLGQCLKPSTVADHYPLSKRELIAQGMDDHDPQHGRGLCADCHNHETAHRQPGGWHQR